MSHEFHFQDESISVFHLIEAIKWISYLIDDNLLVIINTIKSLI